MNGSQVMLVIAVEALTQHLVGIAHDEKGLSLIHI